jgi:cytoskeletal protein CcmA (bactofilin family)
MKKTSGSGNDLNIIAAGTVINGDIKSPGNIRLEGKIKGTIDCGSMFTLADGGIVEGDVVAEDAVIGGQVTGSITVKGKVNLESSSKFSGELQCARLSIDEGAVFEGKSSMAKKDMQVSSSSNKAL